MLLAGDIHTNPGPRQNYPCTVCHENVKTKYPSVSCDICEGWSHTVCVGIPSDEYRELCGKDTFTFLCPRCTLSELPSYQSSSEHDFDSTNSIDNSRSEAITTSGIRVVNINVNGLKGTAKRAYFHAFLDEMRPDIVIGTESKLDSTCSNEEIFPDRYSVNVIRRDRNCHGGGVFVLAKDELAMAEVHVKDPECPMVLANITLKDKTNITIGAFYRQPNTSLADIESLVTAVMDVRGNETRVPEMIIGGDFNLPSIEWGDEVKTKDPPSYGREINSRFIDVCDELGGLFNAWFKNLGSKHILRLPSFFFAYARLDTHSVGSFSCTLRMTSSSTMASRLLLIASFSAMGVFLGGFTRGGTVGSTTNFTSPGKQPIRSNCCGYILVRSSMDAVDSSCVRDSWLTGRRCVFFC